MKLFTATLLTLAYALVMIWLPAAYLLGGFILLRAAWTIDQKASP